MSLRSIRKARQIARETARSLAQTIAENQVRELFNAPFVLRLKFALRLIFRK
jgi:hypothetical protein